MRRHYKGMGNFWQFYQQGGFFMHFVALSAFAAAFHTIRSRSLARRVTPTSARTALARSMDLASGCIGLAMAIGVLGTLFGLMETAMAVQSAAPEDVVKGTLRGVAISLNTTTFALMLAIPLALAAIANRAAMTRRLEPESA